MSLATIRESPGLDAYLEELEERLTAAVQASPGLVAAVGGEALAAGGKRLRPLLVFLAAPPGRGAARGRRRGRARPHGDARPRRPDRPGAATGAAARPPGRATGPRRREPPATTSSRARSPSWLRPATTRAVRCLAGATLSLARGEALQRAQTNDPETSVESYLERCALKTGKLFEAACLLGSGGDEGLGEFGLALGIAFQIADDILDCSGETIETGKIAGTDLREGTPTLPLILAAREDENVRRALAGGPLERRAAPRRRDRRARGLARARARLRAPRARLPGRASAAATSSRPSPTPWSTGSRDRDQARPHLLREHGAGLLPARGRGRGSPGRADRAERAAAERRARPRADLLDRVRAQRRPPAPAAAALRLLRGRGRLDPARRAQAARAGADGRGHTRERDLGRADEGAAARRPTTFRSARRPTRRC